jgi:hypothetical protein
VEGSEVVIAFLELTRAGGEKFICGQWFSEVRDEEGSERDVEREDRLDTMMGHEEGGVASGLANRCAVCPECVRGDGGPLRNVALTGLDD